MSTYPDCHETSNVICKHVRSTKTFYVDLNARLATGVTISAPEADSEDADLEITDIVVVTENTTIAEDSDCGGLVLISNRAIQMTVSGGTPSDDEAKITVCWDTSDGDHDCVDCRIQIGGVAATESV